MSADKDGYVPPQSARVQMCDASIRDAKREVPHGQVGVGGGSARVNPFFRDKEFVLFRVPGEELCCTLSGRPKKDTRGVGKVDRLSIWWDDNHCCLV